MRENGLGRLNRAHRAIEHFDLQPAEAKCTRQPSTERIEHSSSPNVSAKLRPLISREDEAAQQDEQQRELALVDTERLPRGDVGRVEDRARHVEVATRDREERERHGTRNQRQVSERQERDQDARAERPPRTNQIGEITQSAIHVDREISLNL